MMTSAKTPVDTEMPTTTPGDRDFFDGVPDGTREVAAAAVTMT
jgi:hypothetical protein